MAPIAGLVRLRKHQFGRQQIFGTKVAATQAYAFSGVPDVDLNWTDPEADTGSTVVTVAPERGAGSFTAPLAANSLEYNMLPLLMSGFFGGQESPTGAGVSKTWTHDPPATSVVDPDPFTYNFGDDVTTDWYQLGDGIIDTLEISGPEGLGALTASAGWRFGSASSTGSTDSPVTGTVPTPALSVDTAAKKIYLKDGAIYVASSVAGLGAGQISDALHNFTLSFGGEIDEKRWANGDQSFDIDALARVSTNIELSCTFSKTADIVGTGSEADAWFSDDAVNRYVRMIFTSTAFTTGATPYSWQFTMPMRYYTREEGESGGNTVVTLTGHAFYDPTDFTGYFQSIAVTTLSEAELGLGGS